MSKGKGYVLKPSKILLGKKKPSKILLERKHHSRWMCKVNQLIYLTLPKKLKEQINKKNY